MLGMFGILLVAPTGDMTVALPSAPACIKFPAFDRTNLLPSESTASPGSPLGEGTSKKDASFFSSSRDSTSSFVTIMRAPSFLFVSSPV